MNITIIDLYCASNRGDAAILMGTTEVLKNKFPNADILVLSSFPETVIEIAKIDRCLNVPVYVRDIYTGTFKMLRFILWGFFKKININMNRVLKYEDIKIAEALYESDLIIGCGGGYLNDNYRPAILGRLFNLWFGKFLQKPVMIVSQSIGPFNIAFYKLAAKIVLNKVDLITLRDNKSKLILAQLGVNRPSIHVTADAAFGLYLENIEYGKSLLDYEGFNSETDSLKVSISVRKWNYYHEDNLNSHQNYIKSVANIADYLVETKNAKIIFASTCTNFGGYHHDDRAVAQEVIDKMKYDAKILSGEYSPQQLSAIYGCMDFHIGTRMHSNILSMLSGTPVIAIEYEFKTSEMMHFFELEDFVLDINNIDMEHFKHIIGTVIDKKDEINKKMSAKLAELRVLANRNADLVSYILSNYK